ncbi:hypothetical protein D3C87_1940090 [compost metagenome]
MVSQLHRTAMNGNREPRLDQFVHFNHLICRAVTGSVERKAIKVSLQDSCPLLPALVKNVTDQ